jgi:hypothetical protein
VLHRGNELLDEYYTPLDGGFELSPSEASKKSHIDAKLQLDEADEMTIYQLEQELAAKRGMLDQAKYKYEQRQIFELNEQEQKLKERLNEIDRYQREQKNYESLK